MGQIKEIKKLLKFIKIRKAHLYMWGGENGKKKSR